MILIGPVIEDDTIQMVQLMQEDPGRHTGKCLHPGLPIWSLKPNLDMSWPLDLNFYPWVCQTSLLHEDFLSGTTMQILG